MTKEYKYHRKTFTFDGRRYEVTGKTLEEAILKKAEKIRQLEDGSSTRSGSVTLSKWAESAFRTYKPNVSEEYLEQTLQRFGKHVLKDLGAYPIDKITRQQLQQILNRQRDMSASHIRKLSQEIFFVFDCARKDGLITSNPAADLTRPKGSTKKRRALTEDERAHLLAVIPTDPRFVFFSLMLYAGCRPGEAANVKYEDLVERQGVYFLHIRGTKTANSDRLVPLAKELHPLFLDRPKKGFCALTQAGTQHNESSYKRMVESLKRAMNISMGAKVYRNQLVPPLPLADDFVPYLLRHTFCTDLKKKGVDVRIARDLMGHADIKTTANIYDHNDDDSLMLAAAQMGLRGK